MSALRASLLCAGLALCAPAQAEQIRFDTDQMTACVEAGGGQDCVGIAVDACMERLGGWSTPAHQACSWAEYEWWDGYLNAVYQRAVTRSRGIDATSGTQGTPDRPSDEEALRVMQRAWIAYRDATCTYEQLQWWGGTGASGAHSECLTRVTADQALLLRGFQVDE